VIVAAICTWHEFCGTVFSECLPARTRAQCGAIMQWQCGAICGGAKQVHSFIFFIENHVMSLLLLSWLPVSRDIDWLIDWLIVQTLPLMTTVCWTTTLLGIALCGRHLRAPLPRSHPPAVFQTLGRLHRYERSSCRRTVFTRMWRALWAVVLHRHRAATLTHHRRDPNVSHYVYIYYWSPARQSASQPADGSLMMLVGRLGPEGPHAVTASASIMWD